MKCLIVGGVAGGAAAAARLRRLDETAEIVIFEKDDCISYANCGMPYYIGEVICEREKLFLQSPDSFTARFNVEIRVNSEVEIIDRARKRVTVQDRMTGKRYEESYDKLILSPGANPVRPPLRGMDIDGVFTLRNINDMDRMMGYIDKHSVTRALIVGGGFIGMEMAENLHSCRIRVAVVDMADQVLSPVDFEIAAVVHQHLKAKGVGLYLEDALTSMERKGRRIEAVLASGTVMLVDMVLFASGVRPNARLAREAGLVIGETGGIKVNEYLQTSDPDIYAVGDAIEYPHAVSGRPALTFLAGPATKQARICANNIIRGNREKYAGSIGTAIAKVLDLTVATAGLSAKALDRLEIPYKEVIIHGPSHAGYYPDSVMLNIKINFSPLDGRLLGAQAVGAEGVDKRMEMLSSVIRSRGTIYDLMRLEQAYAPPFSSAKDPVNMAGFVADNILMDMVDVISWRELQEMDPEQITLVDVRTRGEFAEGSIPGAVNIPLDGSRSEYNDLPKNRLVVVYCAIGLRGYIAARIIAQNGYDVVNLNGGYRTYAAASAGQNNPLDFE